MRNNNVVVIGAGIAGLSTSYYLNKAGLNVTVLDRDDGNDNCSYGNAGLIVPSHFMPLASPGMIVKAIKMMLKAESSFYIKPRFDKELIAWGWNFRKASTAKHAEESAPVLKELLLANRDLLVELEQQEALDFGLQRKGLLMLCNSEKGFKEEKEVVRKANQLGMAAKMLSADEVNEMEPHIDMNIIGAGYYPEDAHFHPGLLMNQLKAKLKERGVKFRFHTEVMDLEKDSEVITGVKTADGNFYDCSGVVICAGSWSSMLARRLDISMPMQAGKGYSITVQNPDRSPQNCMMFTEAYVAVTPMNGALRFAGTMEMAGLDKSINQNKINALIKSVCQYLPEFSVEDLRRHDIWVGLRPCSPDGLPYVGKLTQYDNVYISTGHAMLGMSLGLISGKIISNLIMSGEAEDDHHHLLHPDRYN